MLLNKDSGSNLHSLPRLKRFSQSKPITAELFADVFPGYVFHVTTEVQ